MGRSGSGPLARSATSSLTIAAVVGVILLAGVAIEVHKQRDAYVSFDDLTATFRGVVICFRPLRHQLAQLPAEPATAADGDESSS